ncbi:EVE domain-containing protein [Sulfolobales archaeon HS-7]|nr:EVE domain-containing protein [Sulfolobales archaeon HS-7]
MKYWLIPIQEDDWNIIKTEKVYGYKKELSDLIKKGDRLIIYVSKYYAKRYGGKIVGILEIVSDWFIGDKPIFTEERVVNKVTLPFRAKVEVLVDGVCDLKMILDNLIFIEDKYQLAKYLRNAPANLKRPIPEVDANKIAECLKQSEL